MYLRSEGATHALSASRLPETLGATVAAVPLGGDAELRHVYFFSRRLTEGSGDPDDCYLYRYDTATGQLLALAAAALDAQEAHALQVSADGGSVYFSSPSALTPDADDEHENIYVWRDGTVEQVAALAPSGGSWESPVDAYWSSPNGRYFAFLAGTPSRMYRFDADTETLVCASCPPGGATPSGSAGVPVALGAHDGPRLVDDRGEVFFDSPDQLAPGDRNDARDVYEYSDGAGLRLLSSDSGGGGSRLAAVDDDGRDVFFATADRLVPTDDDSAVDLYDARRGGGIPSQSPAEGTSCASCGGSAAATPGSPTPLAPPRRKSHRRHSARRHRAAHRRHCHGGKRHRRCHGRGHQRREKRPR